MQLLKAQCPYCSHDVETSTDQLDEPVVCPSCDKPFEVEIPRVKVTSVRDADEDRVNQAAASFKTSERTLKTVHPVVIREHLIGTLILILVIAAAGFGLWWSLIQIQENRWAPITTWASVAGLVAVLLVLAWWYLESIATTLTITNNRTILRKGLIRKNTSEVQHDDVRNLQIEQSFSQRLLGIGEIGISSSGQDDLEIIVRGIPDPSGIAEVIRKHQV